MFLFIADRNLGRRKIITSPLELNDAIVSTIKVAIGSPSFETFLDKSLIVKVILEPIPIIHIFVFLCGIHSPKFPSHASSCLLDFAAKSLLLVVVIDVNGRCKLSDPRFPKA